MGIEQDNIFKVVDSTYINIESEFQRLKDIIEPRVRPLLPNTGVGVGAKNRDGPGIPWKDLMKAAFDLVDKGIVEITYEDGIPIVNVERLQSIEIKLGRDVLEQLKEINKGKKLTRVQNRKLTSKLLSIDRERIVLTDDDE